ncbi:MAG TPA: toll/interleukin-1 receptor domain-containing protein [Polyangiaceae bacterium]|nr:toll/interleukin-1 receptor domain-containing protein [Polyangiaceae bacterium]
MPHEVFLSYSHRDNGFPHRWVETLHERLEAAAGVKDPDAAFRVFRDPAIRKCETFDDRIKSELKAAQVLLCISSPAYNRSRYCGQELEFFVQHRGFGQTGLVNVQKEPMSVLDQPEPLQTMLGHKFHDPVTKEVFDAADPRFERAVAPLAEELLALVKAGQAPKPRVLLLASDSREDERERLCNDLQAAGIEVVPSAHSPLPRSQRSRDDAIKVWAVGAPGGAANDRALFTVLLLGSDYSSSVDTAFTALDGKWQRGPRRCLLGMPPVGVPLDAAQQGFASRVNSSGEVFDFCDGPEHLLPETLRFLKALRDDAQRVPTLFLSYLKTSRNHATTLRKEIAALCAPPADGAANSGVDRALRVLDPYGDGDGTQLRTQTQTRDKVLAAAHGAILIVDREGSSIHDLLADADGPIPSRYIAIYAPNPAARLASSVLEPYRFLQPAGSGRYPWLAPQIQLASLSIFLADVGARARG